MGVLKIGSLPLLLLLVLWTTETEAQWWKNAKFKFYPKAYVQKKHHLYKKYNPILTKTIDLGLVVDQSLLYTHMVEIIPKDQEPFYRLGSYGTNGEHFMLDISSDAILVGSKPIAVRDYANPKYGKRMRQLLSGEVQPSVDSYPWVSFTPETLNMISPVPHLRYPIMKTFDGGPNNLEHSLSTFWGKDETGTPRVIHTTFWVPEHANQLGAGGRKDADVYDEHGDFVTRAIKFIGGNKGNPLQLGYPSLRNQYAIYTGPPENRRTIHTVLKGTLPLLEPSPHLLVTNTAPTKIQVDPLPTVTGASGEESPHQGSRKSKQPNKGPESTSGTNNNKD